MLDHIGIGMSAFDKSKAFYQAALAPLGLSLGMESEGRVGPDRTGLSACRASNRTGDVAARAADHPCTPPRPIGVAPFHLESDANDAETVCHDPA
ncbi:MAG: hypothetical protein U1E66_07045 [Rhodospirillales bacterium]